MISTPTPLPTDWHTSRGPGEFCSLCGCPRKALTHRTQQHRLTLEADGTDALWLRRIKSPRGWSVTEATIPTRKKRPPKPTNATLNLINRIAALMVGGKSMSAAARMLGKHHNTVGHIRRRHPELWQNALEKARADHEATGQVVIEKLDESGPRQDLRPTIRNAAAMMAAGASHREIVEALSIGPDQIKHWRQTYPDYWKEELDRAMHAAVIVVRRQVGTDAVLEDPDAHIRRAMACKRWATRTGRDLLPKPEATTLRTFYDDYYKPTRLSDASPQTVDSYETTVTRWELLTGDPPLAEITVETLAKFKTCLQKMRGEKRGTRLSPNSIRRHLRHLQAIIDKAGPPGHRNRDAAGIIPQAPWIKPPREELPPPRIVSAEHVDWCYQAAIAMERPLIPGAKPAAWWRALLVVAWNTGLRRRTLFQMPMTAVQWNDRRLVLQPQRLKSNRFEIVPLNTVALEHLRKIRGPRELVFEWPFDLHIFHGDFHRLQDEAGIPRNQHFGLHNIRKTLATMLWEQSPGAAQLALGHASNGVTQRHYVSGFGIVSRALEQIPQPAAFQAAKKQTSVGV